MQCASSMSWPGTNHPQHVDLTIPKWKGKIILFSRLCHICFFFEGLWATPNGTASDTHNDPSGDVEIYLAICFLFWQHFFCVPTKNKRGFATQLPPLVQLKGHTIQRLKLDESGIFFMAIFGKNWTSNVRDRWSYVCARSKMWCGLGRNGRSPR
jgi:hypothetical protein